MEPQLNSVKNLVTTQALKSLRPQPFRIHALRRPEPSRLIQRKNFQHQEEEEPDESLIIEVQDFYKASNSPYKIAHIPYTSSSIQTALKQSRSPLKPHRFLNFRPYIDSMSNRPSAPLNTLYFFSLLNSESKLIRYTLEDNGFKESPVNSLTCSILWHSGRIKSNIYQSLTKYSKINHFPKSFELTRKDLMCKNLARMQAVHGYKAFGFVPKTFVMPHDADMLEREMEQSESTWIVKPSASSQGKGIYLTKRFCEVPRNNHVVSQYIENPLLIDELKFDLRIYVAITSFNPLRIYMYKEGLVRFATQKYNGKYQGSRFMHLTNYSVNKFSENFIENCSAADDGKGSKWSISALKRFFKEQGVDDTALWVKIKDLVIKSIISIEGIVVSASEMFLPYKDNCFELLGFDVLIDDSMNPWLLEVNYSPSLNCDAPIDQKIKGTLIADLFNLAGIVSMSHRNCKLSSLKKGANSSGIIKKTRLYQEGEKYGDSDNNSKERTIIRESVAENRRRGGFERIFPCKTGAAYKNLFECNRPYNALLHKYFENAKKKNHCG